MKTTKEDATKKIRQGLDLCRELEADQVRNRTLVADAERELANLAKSADLTNKATVERIGDLNVIVQFGPVRGQARWDQIASAKELLLADCQAFIREKLAPRAKSLESRMLVRVEAQLKELYPDPDELRAAAHRSGPLQGLSPILAKAIVSDFRADDRAMPLAAELIEAWNAADAFEENHLS